MDPAEFHASSLSNWDRPVIIYRCVGKYAEHELRNWLLGMPFGFHVESVSNRKAEIEASTALAAEISTLIRAS